MILIDTTVWIDFFLGKNTLNTNFLAKELDSLENIAICGVILTEILQGIKNPQEHSETKELLESLTFLPMHKGTFILASDIYRDLRKRGITIRKTIDCLIAAVALENNIPLIHNDRDFEPIIHHWGIKVLLIN